jgi:hypothetical protein
MRQPPTPTLRKIAHRLRALPSLAGRVEVSNSIARRLVVLVSNESHGTAITALAAALVDDQGAGALSVRARKSQEGLSIDEAVSHIAAQMALH